MDIAKKFTVRPVSEENYSGIMQETVEPFLAEHRMNDSFFESFDGNKIHYEAYLAQNPRGSVVISHGFTESAEKFREMSYYFLLAGYNVFAIDHRGHGLSYRAVENVNVSHVDNFDHYIKDFCTFINKVVKPNSKNLPLYLYGHSMGGAVSILYLERHPGVFKKAVLTAPMVVPNTGYSIGVTKALIGLIRVFSKDTSKVFFKPDFDADENYIDSNDTSEARFEYYKEKCRNNSYLQNNAPSYKWVWESLRIIKKMLDLKNMEKIDAKVLLLQAETDRSVMLEPQVEFIKRVKDGEFKKIEGSKHEIYMSENDVLAGYLDTIFDFLD